uniref:Fcf2 pre-rRNA processing C-terminal domain-containing protein n=1 Tax=Anopheles culicifacies TaxID=139723 RepID=A0A182MLS8_9DIPT
MDLFVIDAVGDANANLGLNVNSTLRLSNAFDGAQESSTFRITCSTVGPEESDDDYAGLPPPGQSISNALNKHNNNELDGVPWKRNQTDKETVTAASAQSLKAQAKQRKHDLCRTDVAKELKGAVLTPNIEKTEDIAQLALSGNALRKLNKLDRKKTKGKNWFGMAAPEITTELENELTLIKMRSILDPKQAFKRLDKRRTPKYFEIGKLIDSPLDHFNERGAKKLKSKSLVDELLADAEFQKANKRKYAESLERQKKKAYHKAVMKMKKEKRKNKKK